MKAATKTTSQFGKPAYVASYQLGLDTGLFNARTKEVHILNPVAASIYNQITSGRKVNEIADSILVCFTECSVETKEVEKDVQSMLQYFQSKALVEKRSRGKQTQVGIVTEFSMSQVPTSYFRPAVKFFTQGQLDELNNTFRNRAMFCDVWITSDILGQLETNGQ